MTPKAKGITQLTARIFYFYWKRILFFALCMALGIAFLFTIGNLTHAVTEQVSAQAREILSADIEISSYRKFNDAHQKIIAQMTTEGYTTTHVINFASMIAAKDQSFLASVKAIDESFPLYGELLIDGKKQIGAGECWIAESIELQFDLHTGDTIKLGKAQLQITGIIKKEPGRVFGGGGFAPRIIIANSTVKTTALVEAGKSRVRYAYLFCRSTTHSDSDVEKTIDRLQTAIKETHVRITSYKNTQRNVSRIMERQSYFFLLISIVTLVVGSVGMGASTYSFLNEQLEEVGVFRALGIESHKIFQLYLGLCLLIGILAGVIGAILGYVLNTAGFHYIIHLLQLNLQIQPSVHWWYFAEGIVLSVVLTLVVNYHKIKSLASVSPMEIFRGEVANKNISFLAKCTTFVVTTMVFFLYVWYKSNLPTAGYFCLALIAVIAVTFVMIVIFLKLLEISLHYLTSPKFFVLRCGVRQLVRERSRTFVFLVSLTIGFSLINTLNLVYTSLTTEVFSLSSTKVPNIFLADVLKKQVPAVGKIIEDSSGSAIEFSSLIRARLKSINGEEIKRQVQVPDEELEQYRWRTREYNLTYKNTLNDSEKVIAGRFWQPQDDKPHISLERDFASRANLKMGDVLSFDIQGVVVTGKVTSIRKIDWLSMKPNFFVVMPPKILDEAPQTFIASFKLDSKNKIAQVQKKLSQKFTNVVVINVTSVLETVEKLLGYFLSALQVVAWFCILVGVIILIGTLGTGHRERFSQVALMKTMGCNKRQIIYIDAIEFLCIGFVTAVLSFSISLGLTALHNYYFELSTTINSTQYVYFAFIVLLPLVIGIIVNSKIYGADVMKNFRK
ncbi:ABC transporter permease [Candidatus Uabimicrobium amorphum]|uniref:Sugar ABC transporter permease n=1 Tax=Uabimicrobium amorphum TaxID=2596890 RepID=A0A5S9F6E5_UABAM|nr:FtsX-like permease family protein [Candidatus Uabimicrobium amorphum]BBM86524.1 sugar ABC transporter permease [Candidatus Uabimicrobium amorphum]